MSVFIFRLAQKIYHNTQVYDIWSSCKFDASPSMYILRILVVERWSKFSLQTTSTFKQTVQDSSLYAPWYFLKSVPVQKYQKSMLKQASLQLTGCVTSPWYLSLCTLGIFNEFSVIDQLIISFTTAIHSAVNSFYYLIIIFHSYQK